MKRKNWCGQCGHSYTARACGLRHVVMASKFKRKKRVVRDSWETIVVANADRTHQLQILDKAVDRSKFKHGDTVRVTVERIERKDGGK